MAAISLLNPTAEVAKCSLTLAINMSAAKGIQEVMKTNLGPRGTLKMLVSGSGEVKLTKDGNVLMQEMQIQHPTASLIARAATAQDDRIGDGTTTAVILIGELLKHAEPYIVDGVHPRVIAEGFILARNKCLEVLSTMKIPIGYWRENDSLLRHITRTAIATKVESKLAELLAEICVDAVHVVAENDGVFDLHMIEIMEMMHRTRMDTVLVKGLVLDHGGRHPGMPKRVENAYILTCNISMEYEKTEVNSNFCYGNQDERGELVTYERQFVDERVNKVIALKRKVCPEGSGKNFVVINQKGIDPISLDMLAREGILALRRAKRRNMERLTAACGGIAVNKVEELHSEALGYAGLVYEYVLDFEKYTFVEQCRGPKSATILIKGATKYSLLQIKDAIRDGLHAIYNAIDDKCVIPGAATFEMKAYQELQKYKDTLRERSRLGVVAFSEALLVVPKTLAKNSGFDQRETILKLQAELICNPSSPVGLDLNSGEPLNPIDHGIYDNWSVKAHVLECSSQFAAKLMIVDEMMRAGMSSLRG